MIGLFHETKCTVNALLKSRRTPRMPHDLLGQAPKLLDLNETGMTPWAINCAIVDAIENAKRILEKVDERWPTERAEPPH